MNANDAMGQVTQAAYDVEASTGIVVNTIETLEQDAAMITSVGEGLDQNEQVLAGIKEFADNAGAMWASLSPDHDLVITFVQIESKAEALMVETQAAGEKLDQVVSHFLQAKQEVRELADRLNGNVIDLRELQALLAQVQ